MHAISFWRKRENGNYPAHEINTAFFWREKDSGKDSSERMGFTALHALAAKGATSEIQKLFDHDWIFVSV